MIAGRDHGGGLDAAMAQFGGGQAGWLDLSTGINPVPYPLPSLPPDLWTRLPDHAAIADLEAAARDFWQVPPGAAVVAAPGASAVIARIPGLLRAGTVSIPAPTYNEHAAAFAAAGWGRSDQSPDAQVLVHPNNPDGRLWQASDLTAPIVVIDESFCDIMPDRSLMTLATRPGTIILKSFGKFWGLAGLRLGFAIGDPDLVGKLAGALGPWPVSGPALAIGTAALTDLDWATRTRARLTDDAARLDRMLLRRGAVVVGGTSLFRLYQVQNAADWQARLARRQVWSRVFPYSTTWLRLGLPHPDRWDQLDAAL